MIIRKARARGFDLALSKPVETASGVMLTAPLVLIDLFTDEGIVGKSYLRTYTPLALIPLTQLVANLETLLVGEQVEPAAIDRVLQRSFRLVGMQGLIGMAMAGIDMAIWDARAKAANLPLASLLGGTLEAIPAYASLRTMSPRAAAAEASELVGGGFKAIKVKIGRSDLAADLETIRAVRAAIGD
nr:mandelate racemase [Candidatus Eremiobacteraeota bacterium]